jgi:hypothetical protein
MATRQAYDVARRTYDETINASRIVEMAPVDQQVLFQKLLNAVTATGTGSPAYILDLLSAKPRFFGYCDGGAVGLLTGVDLTVNDSKFHLLTGTFDGTTWSVYVDGVLIGSVDDSDNIVSDGGQYPLYIGQGITTPHPLRQSLIFLL